MAQPFTLHKKDYSTLPGTPSAARLIDVPFYFTGRPCIHGHVAPRRVANSQCRDCHVAAMERVNRNARHRAKGLREV